MPTWEEKLSDRIDPQLAEEINIFETEIQLRKQGKLDEKVFAETRLRRGAYGQRYDNGHRHDGIRTQQLQYDSELTKGPETLWDAPGMQRIKIPFGGLNPDQMDTLADLSEEYADSVLHNAKASARFLLGHPDAQGFGRKFKIAFSGCAAEACGLVNMHDMGAIAVKRVENGKEKLGFELYVGGGLGAVPHDAKLFDLFLPEEELLPITQAIARVFARLGEKKNRAQARVKFLVAKLGIEEFRRLVLEERKILPHDPRWTSYLSDVKDYRETPVRPAAPLNGQPGIPGFAEWRLTNVYGQKQPGYAVATVTLPLGDLSAWQMRELAKIARKFS